MSTAQSNRGGAFAGLAGLAAVLGDNPVLEKDASLLLRRKLAAGAWLVVAIALVGVAAVSWLEGREDLRRWGALDPVGGQMLLALAGVMLAAVNIFLPTLASTSICAERERGTLPLLLVSGLSPARLVGGKLGALLTAAAPFLAIALPLLALASVFLGVDVDAVALAGAAIFVHAFAVASVGVWASAVSARMRSAGVTALLASGVPALLGGVPIFASLVACVDDQQHELLLVGVTGLVVDVLIGLAALVGAWSVLSSRSAHRWRPARALLWSATLGVPLLAAVVIAFFSEKDDTAVGLFAETFGAVLLAALLAVAVTGRRPGTPSPLRVALIAWSTGMIGLGAAFGALLTRISDSPDAADVVAVVAFSLAVAGVAAFVARWQRSPVIVVVATVAVFSVFFAIPAFIDEFTSGTPPLGFLNPAYVLDKDDLLLLPTVLFYGALAVVTLLGARGQRRV